MRKLKLEIKGMKCDGCANAVQAALDNVDGVRRAEVSLDDAGAELVLDDDVEKEDLVRAVEEAGYQARSRGGP